MKNLKVETVIAILIAGLAFTTYLAISSGLNNYRLSLDNKQLIKQQMKSQLDIGKAETNYGNAQKQLKQVNEEVQNWIKENDARATDVGILKGKLNAIMNGQGERIQIVKVPETTIIKGADGEICKLSQINNVDSVSSLGKYVWLDLDGDGQPDTKTNKLILPYKDYRIDIEVDALQNIFNYSLHQNFKGEFVKAITKAGGTVHFIRLNEIDDKGNKIGEIKITDFKVVTENPDKVSKKFFAWNPQIDFGINTNLSNTLKSSVSGEIGLSTSSYGQTKDDNDWRFIRLSIGKSGDKYTGNFSPACWNGGKVIPVVKDLLLCPTIGYTNSQTVYGVSIANPF